MAENSTLVTLEPPPRTTGNSQQDFPLVVDWMWKAYQVINQSIQYIIDQASASEEIDGGSP